MTTKIGILLTNTGTPDAPTPKAVRGYLREFLSDKRIVQLPRLIWLPILYGLVLPFRAPKSAALYREIWTEQGSPLRTNMLAIVEHLKAALKLPVECGMNYGAPTIRQGLHKLHQQAVEKIIVLPLFPQYSHTTTASTYDAVQSILKKTQLALHFIQDYADEPAYIDALAENVQHIWLKEGAAKHLLISFHGIPQRYSEQGDPYRERCEKTAHLLAEKLQLSKDQWTLCYQSQFGYSKWLQPSTQNLFEALPKQNIKNIDVICPGFSVDCLETLEEIAATGKKSFLNAGGEAFRYLPCLNAKSNHIAMIKKLLEPITST